MKYRFSCVHLSLVQWLRFSCVLLHRWSQIMFIFLTKVQYRYEYISLILVISKSYVHFKKKITFFMICGKKYIIVFYFLYQSSSFLSIIMKTVTVIGIKNYILVHLLLSSNATLYPPVITQIYCFSTRDKWKNN